MVDIHSHILYGVDDGAKTLEESLAMLELAAAAGTTDIVATPHSDLRFSFDRSAAAKKVALLQARSGGAIRIHLGCDFHLHFDNIRSCLADPARFTINGRRYLMVEFDERSIPKNISDVFRDMMQREITPVITHPERNALLMSDIARLVSWVRFGCLIQVTGQSFTGRFGKAAESHCHLLMRRKLVHFVASDAHDTEWRPPDLRAARREVADKYGAASAALLFETYPRMALEGTYIDCEEPVDESPGRTWFRLW